MELYNISQEQSSYIVNNFGSIKSDDIISFLNQVFGVNWSYSVKDIKDNEYNANLHIIITLVTPIRTLDGVAFENLDISKDTITHALNKAIYSAFSNSIKGLIQNVALTPKQPINTPQASITVQETKPESVSQFSDQQKKEMTDFYVKYSIQNDEQLLSYLKTWNKTMTSINQLNPGNIDDFLKYIYALENVGRQGM